MTSLSNLGIGLSLVFSLLLLALVAELYYLLWWKKKRVINNDIQDDYSSSCSSSSAREFLYLFCWKKPSSLSSTGLNPQELFNDLEQQSQLSSSKQLYLNSFGEDSIEAELMRLHNLSGPPRLLFTIKEETKEDLESEDGRSRNNKVSRKSLADFLVAVETPFLTPMSSPRLTPPLTPIHSYNQSGINPLFESSVDPEMYKIRPSPPPKFKFLKDAEDKFCKRRLIEEALKKVQKNAAVSPTSSMASSNEEDGSFTVTVVNKHKESEFDHYHHHHQNSSQILPLSSSPSPSPSTVKSSKH
ncbi:uncharacterized protein LOC113351668 [Papaver somniferum]|uniref:uncharacterized protein LOC113351668 n=1 Tax=Papaver somniferum TaxID=3469 RepID=UPI000E6FD398|nr:uncharacterized protein LOC113351668 [Papaver somniferum]